MSQELKTRIAIVDDDPGVREMLADLLHSHGFEPLPLAGGKDYFALGENPGIDLAIIDLRLDGESGLTLAKNIRASQDIPIMMVTGIGDEVDKIIGLETGADDYLMKPFNPRELIARIRAILRRYNIGISRKSASRQAQFGNTIHFGDYIVDLDQRDLRKIDGEEISLTNSEFRLLEYFARNPNRIIERVELLGQLGSDLSQYVDRTVDVIILRLRRKIEPIPSKPVHLQTRRKRGYIFVVANENGNRG
ncbi:Two-component transcriptional response regulator, LuxR family [hydrothermal vent metagenome]|uniref:Two-component transcriptional response regulator, LuxR family n=1 Tax=hydrothermal vent metagenome TaxID=652676 RepID=A0A3B0U9M3_9ZZZZ